MINKRTLVAMGAGLVVAAVLVAAIVFIQRGSTPRLVGEISRVRTLEMDPSSSVAIADFRFTNDSHYAFIIATIDLSVIDFKGETRPGQVISASDANRLFQLFPALGTKTAEPLIIKTKVAPGASVTGMVAARFELSKTDLDARRKIILTITDVDGPVSELSQ
jgi:hypothetical protein